MNNPLNSKIAAAAILGWLFTLYVHHDYAKWHLAGRQAFLSFQANRYDTKMFGPHAPGFLVFIILSLIIFGMYELIALAVFKILATVIDPKSQPTTNLPLP